MHGREQVRLFRQNGSQSAGRVQTRSVSSPRSSNRTCSFPASGFPTGFVTRHTSATLAHAVQHKHARVSIDLTGKPSDATAGRIVSSTQKGEHAVEDVSINSLMGRGK